MNIVLLEPEIAANTGNIGRSCLATGSVLHLIKPLGFRTDDRHIKRAGMDYWDELDVQYYDDFEDFVKQNNHPTIYMATTKAQHLYTAPYEPNPFIMFGKESKGIPEEILVNYQATTIRIPMKAGTRSLNLANSVAIVAYEVARQNDFAQMTLSGDLHRLTWND